MLTKQSTHTSCPTGYDIGLCRALGYESACFCFIQNHKLTFFSAFQAKAAGTAAKRVCRLRFTKLDEEDERLRFLNDTQFDSSWSLSGSPSDSLLSTSESSSTVGFGCLRLLPAALLVLGFVFLAALSLPLPLLASGPPKTE